MNILHISTTDNSGGAARAAILLHNGLKKQGHNSSMFVVNKNSSDPDIKLYRPPQNLMNRFFRRLRQSHIEFNFRSYLKARQESYEIFSDNSTQYISDIFEQLPACEVINLHWIANFIDYRYFFNHYPNHIPIVWTLHDMNPFTGGCHYNNGCNKFQNNCGACPQLGSNDSSDLSHRIWQRKNNIYKSIPIDRLHFVTPSLWLSQELQKSSLLNKYPVSVIPNSLDTDIFYQKNRFAGRDAMEVPHHARVILFVGDSTENRRKGFSLLAQALEGLQDSKDLFLISVGSGKPQIKVSIPHLHLGHIGNDHFLSLVYSISDIFVIPSIQDNLPNTVLESMACGTPIIGFDVGGIPDMVRPGITGFLVPSQDVNTLRNVIKEVLNNPDHLEGMRAHCRRIAVEEYSIKTQARRYLALYQEMIEKNHFHQRN